MLDPHFPAVCRVRSTCRIFPEARLEGGGLDFRFRRERLVDQDNVGMEPRPEREVVAKVALVTGTCPVRRAAFQGPVRVRLPLASAWVPSLRMAMKFTAWPLSANWPGEKTVRLRSPLIRKCPALQGEVRDGDFVPLETGFAGQQTVGEPATRNLERASPQRIWPETCGWRRLPRQWTSKSRGPWADCTAGRAVSRPRLVPSPFTVRARFWSQGPFPRNEGKAQGDLTVPDQAGAARLFLQAADLASASLPDNRTPVCRDWKGKAPIRPDPS